MGIGVISGYMYWKFGDATLSSKVQAAWGREKPSVLNIFRSSWSPFSQHFSFSSILDYAIMLLFLFLGFHALRVRGIFWAATIILPMLLGMSTGTVLSMKRYALSSFPAFIDAAELMQKSWLFWGTVLGGIAIQLFLIYWYVNWGFVKG